jgi:hypothetical protein
VHGVRATASASPIGGLVGKKPHKKGFTFRQRRAFLRKLKRLREAEAELEHPGYTEADPKEASRHKDGVKHHVKPE